MTTLGSTLSGWARAAGIRRGGSTFEAPPPGTDPAGPPSRREIGNEALTVLQIPRLLVSSPRLLSAPRGDGSVVFDLPGWRSPEASMLPIRNYLRWLGYDARTWGLGTNRGNVEGDVEKLIESAIAAADESEQPVSFVGWSLGGVVAREVAREIPELVSRVVTFGSPVVGGPNHTLAARSYSTGERSRAERIIEDLDRDNPLAVPITAIFTRRDGVVNWRACIDRKTPGVRHIEVASSHVGLGIDPDVWQATAEALAA